MDDDRPTSDTIREAVAREDPAAWGARTDTTTTSTSSFGTSEPVASAAVVREPVMSDRGVVAHAEPPVERRRFSLGATFLGWAVAAFFTLVFSTIVLALAGGSAAADGTLSFSDVDNAGLISLVGYLVAAFLAYLIGGYAAGRIALWDGVKHGLGTVAWAILFAVVGVLAGAYIADVANLPDVGLAAFDVGDVTTFGLVAIVASLLAMLAGAALGGSIGQRYHDRAHGLEPRDRRVTRMRGRPL